MSVITDVKNYTDEEKLKYARPILKIALPFNGVSFYNYKGNKYMIGQVDQAHLNGYDSFLISYDNNGKMEVVKTFYSDGEFQYEDDKVGMVKDTDTAGLDDKNNLYLYQLLYTEAEGEEEEMVKAFFYIQYNKVTSNRLIQVYDVTDYPNPNLVLNYLNGRQKNGIQFNVATLFGRKEEDYAFKPEYDGYIKYKQLDGGKSKVLGRRLYGEQYLLDKANTYGFATDIPNELIEIYKGNNERFNDMKNITDAYIKSTR